MYITISTSSLY